MHNLIQKMTAFAAVLALGASVAMADEKSGKLSDPIEILKKADAASKAVKVAEYEAKSYLLTPDGEPALLGHGKAIIEGFAGRGPEKYRIEGTFKRPNSEEEKKITVGGDGEEFYVIDWAKKKAYVDIDPAVMGSTGQAALAILMAEYTHATPFTDELNGTAQEFMGVEKVADEECYHIRVQYSSINQQAHWYFSTKTFLPHRVDRLFTQDGKVTRGTRLVVTSLTPDPKFKDNPYKFKLPEGVEQIDDFAP